MYFDIVKKKFQSGTIYNAGKKCTGGDLLKTIIFLFYNAVYSGWDRVVNF